MRRNSRRRESAGQRVGNESERVVESALALLKEKKRIIDYRKQDQPGIDFFIIRLDRKEVPIQVKSSIKHAEEHRRKYAGILVIIVEHGYTSIPDEEFTGLERKVLSDIAHHVHV